MGQPDFRAFEGFVRAGNDAPVTFVPRSETGPTSHFLHINLAAYASAAPEVQENARAKIMAHLDESGTSPDIKTLYADFLEEAKMGPSLGNSGGGVVTPEERALFLTDPRTISQSAEIENVLGHDLTKDTSVINHYAQEKVRRHEAAHATLGLEEPGSDFMAAATMLRDHPESRKMWENEADLRLVYGLQNGVPTLASYGVECHDAIRRALAMTPQELQNASTQTLYAIGVEYDTQNALNKSLGPKSAEGQILQAIAHETGRGMYDSLLKSQWDNVAAGKPLVQENALEAIRLNQSTTENMVRAVDKMETKDPDVRRIADAMKESVGRLEKYAENPSPAPSPKPDVNTAPALVN